MTTKFEQAIRLAVGCHDHYGGHSGFTLSAFHDGIDAVISALDAASKAEIAVNAKLAETTRERIVSTLADVVATIRHHDLGGLPIRGRWSDGETLGDALTFLGEDVKTALFELELVAEKGESPE